MCPTSFADKRLNFRRGRTAGEDQRTASIRSGANRGNRKASCSDEPLGERVSKSTARLMN